ncbi:MAG: tRNA (guanosine(46)-N7)-methyltransferase TrmB [Lachnospiraceae bacterium]|nr:tRNA (guanosine(46)-N7)-methyltransferase TrmB [Lachnospiraceae bacterium]MCI9546313.1 tRNA (guanosine(46)-N7)-methyltransferase TrmB [Lachnospiraceae bacterium]
MRLRNIPEAKNIVENSPFVVQNPCCLRGAWNKFWQNTHPIHLEVGMGKGMFLMEMSQRHPENNYLGMELYDSVLLRAIQKRQTMEKPMENLYFLCADARMLPDIFAEKEIQKIYLNFSDPWPKARHSKRRLTSRQFLERYKQILSLDGTVEFKTDNLDLFEFSLQEVKESGWTLISHTYDLHQDQQMNQNNVMTEYEEKFSSMGNPICKLVARM